MRPSEARSRARSEARSLQAPVPIRRYLPNVRALIRRWVRDEGGATAVEYGLVLGGIAAVIIVVVYAFGGKVNNLYGSFTTRWPN